MRETYLVDVLALELRKKLAETLLVSVNADCAQNALDILGGWRCVAGEAEEEVCCEVLHLGCLWVI